MDLSVSHQQIAQASLVGMGLDLLGGCYLSYDLLGGKKGPLRTLARGAGYFVLFFAGYALVLGWRFAMIAAAGMAALLAREFAPGFIKPGNGRRAIILFGFARGVVLGLACMTLAGPAFGAVFGLFSGAGLAFFYWKRFSPSDDFDEDIRPRLSSQRIKSSLTRAIATSVAGLIAGVSTRPHSDWLRFGLRLGVAAGTVSALVGLFSPMIEWRIENLPDKRLGVAGLCLIGVGMILQSAQYWIVIFDVAVR
jgi:hypothetical protein